MIAFLLDGAEVALRSVIEDKRDEATAGTGDKL
jgi:hypothetical protein